MDSHLTLLSGSCATFAAFKNNLPSLKKATIIANFVSFLYEGNTACVPCEFCSRWAQHSLHKVEILEVQKPETIKKINSNPKFELMFTSSCCSFVSQQPPAPDTCWQLVLLKTSLFIFQESVWETNSPTCHVEKSLAFCGLSD